MDPQIFRFSAINGTKYVLKDFTGLHKVFMIAGSALNMDREVLFIEVSLMCYPGTLFSSCKV